ncbi:glycosyl hydrolase [Longirhabdus pacifica]|uniref:glycosyl hydrolase n=1 Tax=Longirhabdus pacifica TaxID=2305227 RepID=UPI001008DDFE|nr:glycosyl hydrolase [Longirhabdus pacifica]
MQTINPNSTEEAKMLLGLLYTMDGVITGQHEYMTVPEVYTNFIYNEQDKYPGLVGYQLAHIVGEDEEDWTDEKINLYRSKIVEKAIAHWNRGGIVHMSYHQTYPFTKATWGNITRNTTQAEFDQCLLPGSNENAWLLSEYDKLADHLETLQNNGVPILFRPYHEMNGYWFWYAGKTPESFQKLWNLLYDRLVNYHNLNNILWVWGPNSKSANDINITRLAYYYVGHHRCDVLSQTLYTEFGSRLDLSTYDELYEVGQGKPIAIAECGKIPSIDLLQSLGLNYRWFMCWGKYINDPTMENGQVLENTLGDRNQAYQSIYSRSAGEFYLPKTDFDIVHRQWRNINYLLQKRK